MEKGKFYEFKIKGWEDTINGIIEAISQEWVLVKWIISDYIFDGYAVIRKKYIKKCIQNENIIFQEGVLRAKGIMDIPVSNIPIDSNTSPFNWFCENKSVIVIYPIDESICDVGYITKVLKRVFYFKNMDHKGIWDTIEDNCLISDVVMISIGSDYVNSLLNYNMKQKE